MRNTAFRKLTPASIHNLLIWTFYAPSAYRNVAITAVYKTCFNRS